MRVVIFLLVVLSLFGCAATPEKSTDKTLLIFAAASLHDVLTTLQPSFEAQTGVRIEFNFAGSNVLAQQILAAPRADLFASANEAWMDAVAEAGLLAPDSRRVLASNRLMVIAPGGPTSKTWRLNALNELGTLPFRFLSLADPEAVPAGLYARQALERARMANGSVWEAVHDRVVPAADVRGALALVVARDDTVGIVYRSDFFSDRDRVSAIYEVPPEASPEIRYSIAVLRQAPEQAQEFVDFLAEDTARRTFREFGFEPVGGVSDG